jgi:dihydrofolate reductase
MRKVIVGVAVSLDGYIEGPKGEYDWCFTDGDYGLTDFFKRVDALFMGRKTYELAQSQKEGGGAGFPKMTTYVFSNTLQQVKKGAVLVSGDIKEQVERIKAAPGKDIWLFGGASLTSALMNLHLVDEVWLSVHPIILGGGKPLFQDIKERISLKLVEEKTYSSGLVSLWYTLRDSGTPSR